MSKIIVKVQLGDYPSHDDIALAVQLDHRESDAFQQIDSAEFGGITMFFHTPIEKANRITRDRKYVADMLTHTILKALAERDLINGHPK